MTRLAVLLGARHVADIDRAADGSLTMRYRDDADPSSPVSISMPVEPRPHRDDVVRPWLRGLLPDNAEVLARWGRRFGVSVASPFPLLTTPVGLDCAGAVRFCAPENVSTVLADRGGIDWLSEAEIGARVASLRADAASWLGPGALGQFSLGGAQAKTALHRSADGRWGLPFGDVPTTHIIKPAIVGLDDQDVNEHVCLATARALGLRAAQTSVETFDGQPALVVERFDRLRREGEVVRLHQEDLCQAMSVDPSAKYEADGGPGVARTAELLRRVVPGAAATTDVWRFAESIGFNWLVGGTDAHAKNYGLLLAGGAVRLAPLYDVASYLPYDDSDGRKVKLAMKIGGEYRLDRLDRPEPWRRCAADLGVQAEELHDRLVSLVERLPEAMAGVVAELPPDATAAGERLHELVAERCRRCAAALV